MRKALIDYLPDILREIREFKVINAAEQLEADTLWNSVATLFDCLSVDTLPKYAVLRWEKILKITSKLDDTLETRRFRILTRLNNKLPYTEIALNELLETLCGKENFDLFVDADNYFINIRVALTARSSFEDVYNFIHKIRPANMIVDLSLMYTQNKSLSKYTHRELSEYTHYALRNEVSLNG